MRDDNELVFPSETSTKQQPVSQPVSTQYSVCMDTMKEKEIKYPFCEIWFALKMKSGPLKSLKKRDSIFRAWENSAVKSMAIVNEVQTTWENRPVHCFPQLLTNLKIQDEDKESGLCPAWINRPVSSAVIQWNFPVQLIKNWGLTSKFLQF